MDDLRVYTLLRAVERRETELGFGPAKSPPEPRPTKDPLGGPTFRDSRRNSITFPVDGLVRFGTGDPS